MSMVKAVELALNAAHIEPQDQALSAALRGYAALLDAEPTDADTWKDIGPKLVDALTKLNMTPASRSKTTGTKEPAVGGDLDVPRNPLDELRARRAARLHGASAVDEAVT